jgi:hypothetical protein
VDKFPGRGKGQVVEIIQRRDLDAREAGAITERIKSAMGDLMVLVVKAWQGRVWIALGYQSWEDYIKGEFSHAPLSLPRDERRAVGKLLRGEGMSTRAIAPPLGVSQRTVSNDQKAGQNYAPADEAVIDAEVIESAATEQNCSVEDERVPIICLDARVRNYPVTTGSDPAHPKRDVPNPKPSNAFANRFYRALSVLQENALRLEILTKNKGFAENIDAVVDGHRDGVVWVQEIIARVLEKMHTDQVELF